LRGAVLPWNPAAPLLAASRLAAVDAMARLMRLPRARRRSMRTVRALVNDQHCLVRIVAGHEGDADSGSGAIQFKGRGILRFVVAANVLLSIWMKFVRIAIIWKTHISRHLNFLKLT
jgi:hypothetical protein